MFRFKIMLINEAKILYLIRCIHKIYLHIIHCIHIIIKRHIQSIKSVHKINIDIYTYV